MIVSWKKIILSSEINTKLQKSNTKFRDNPKLKKIILTWKNNSKLEKNNIKLKK